MKITRKHLEEFLRLRQELREREERLETLKTGLLMACKQAGGKIEYQGVGRATLVERNFPKFNEERLMKALGTNDLTAYKDFKKTESVLVTGR
jgi:hypothetical protein